MLDAYAPCLLISCYTVVTMASYLARLGAESWMDPTLSTHVPLAYFLINHIIVISIHTEKMARPLLLLLLQHMSCLNTFFFFTLHNSQTPNFCYTVPWSLVQATSSCIGNCHLQSTVPIMLIEYSSY